MKPLALLACLVLSGCAAKHVRETIPPDCLKIRVTDFTEPCEVLKDGDLLCDRVRVHVNCIKAK